MLVCTAAVFVQAAVIDDFDDGDLSDWTSTVILDASGGDSNTSGWQISGGVMQLVTSLYDGIEQYALIKTGVSLAVGEELQVKMSHTGASQDLGLYVGGTTPVTGMREDYIAVYARSNGQVYSRGFDGTSEYGLAGGSSPAYDRLFIARTADNVYEAGYYEAGTRNIITTRSPSSPNVATVIGFYADVRDVGTLGDLDNLAIVTDATPPSIVTNPDDATVKEVRMVVFATVFTSETTPSASWYKVASPDDLLVDPSDINVQLTYDAQNEQYTSTMTISNVTKSHAGQYYCQITNDSDTTQDSNTATLTVYGLIAHLTLNQDRYSNDEYLEEESGYDADVTGTPTFVTGADGTADGAVQITETDGWALVPVFDPAQQSGQMTISFWANWSETQVTEADLQVDSSDDGQLVMTNGLKSDSQWQHICTVYDGSTGKLYVDGILRDEGPWPLPGETDAAINIGISSDEANVFNGAMDDVRVYNYAMTEFEVADLRYEFSGERSCILEYGAAYDLSGPNGQPDCVIDLDDLIAFAAQWLNQYDIDNFAELSDFWQFNGFYPSGN